MPAKDVDAVSSAVAEDGPPRSRPPGGAAELPVGVEDRPAHRGRRTGAAHGRLAVCGSTGQRREVVDVEALGAAPEMVPGPGVVERRWR